MAEEAARIWKKNLTVEHLNTLGENTIHRSLGIVFTKLDDNSIEAEMPVDARTKQPMGLLHGGASSVLAESLGSVASYLTLEDDTEAALGIEINANHLRPVREGKVIGRAIAIQLGQTIHVWDIRITNEQGALVCVARLTVMIREAKPT